MRLFNYTLFLVEIQYLLKEKEKGNKLFFEKLESERKYSSAGKAQRHGKHHRTVHYNLINVAFLLKIVYT